MQLQANYLDTEDKIALSRQFYNDTVLRQQRHPDVPGQFHRGIVRFSSNVLLECGGRGPETHYDSGGGYEVFIKEIP